MSNEIYGEELEKKEVKDKLKTSEKKNLDQSVKLKSNEASDTRSENSKNVITQKLVKTNEKNQVEKNVKDQTQVNENFTEEKDLNEVKIVGESNSLKNSDIDSSKNLSTRPSTTFSSLPIPKGVCKIPPPAPTFLSDKSTDEILKKGPLKNGKVQEKSETIPVSKSEQKDVPSKAKNFRQTVQPILNSKDPNKDSPVILKEKTIQSLEVEMETAEKELENEQDLELMPNDVSSQATQTLEKGTQTEERKEQIEGMLKEEEKVLEPFEVKKISKKTERKRKSSKPRKKPRIIYPYCCDLCGKDVIEIKRRKI